MDNLINTKYWNLVSTISISFIVFVLFSISQLIIVSALIENNFIQGCKTAWYMLVSVESLITEEQVRDVSYANLGLISSISSIVGILVIMFFINFKTTSIRGYLHFNLPKTKLLEYNDGEIVIDE